MPGGMNSALSSTDCPFWFAFLIGSRLVPRPCVGQTFRVRMVIRFSSKATVRKYLAAARI
jgi:hypothetical protein